MNKNRPNAIISILLVIISIIINVPCVLAAGTTPFKDHKLPGTINISDFDEGGKNVSYGTIEGLVSKYIYREGVDLNFYEASFDGAIVGTNRETWFIYTVDVQMDGIYSIKIKGANTAEASMKLVFDGEREVFGTLPPSGSYQSPMETQIGNIELTKGIHTIKYHQLAGGVNLYNMSFTYEGPKNELDYSKDYGNYKSLYLPTRIEAEDFDKDGYVSLDGNNSLGEYRPDEPMDIGKTDTGDNYLFLKTGEKVKYTVYVENPGPYEFFCGVEGDSFVSIYVDGEAICASAEALISNPLSETPVAAMMLSKGVHEIEIVSENGTASLDYIDVVTTTANRLGAYEPVKEIEKKNDGRIYKEIYVSPSGTDEGTGEKDNPYNTVQKAFEAVAAMTAAMDGDIIVHLAEGNYFIDEEIVIDEKCSGRNGYSVILKGDGENHSSVINGGIKISGWKQMENSPIWEADVPEKLKLMRGLYINDNPAVIAKSKYLYEPYGMYHEASEQSNDGLIVPKANFPQSLTNAEDVILGWNLLWTSQRQPVESIDYGDPEDPNVIIKMVQPYWEWVTKHGGQNATVCPGADKMFYIENAFELIDEPGEFYYNKKTDKVYYYPYEKENMTTADVYAAKSEGILRVAGSSNTHKISYFEINNVSFKYGTYTKVDEKGVQVRQADCLNIPNPAMNWYWEEMMPAQVSVDNAKNLTITNCNFSCLGSNALNLADSVINSAVTGNIFKDISGTGILVGNFTHVNILPEGKERVENVEISNNVIRRVAYEYIAGTGIIAYYVKNVNITNNDIKDVPYTGISVGWGWGKSGNVDECRNISVTRNKIENTNSVLHDGAHIYTLGKMHETYISNNYLKNSADYRGGIYFDEGSACLTAENNVVTGVYQWLFARSGAKLSENVVKNNFTDSGRFTQDTANVELSGTTLASASAMPEAAQKIIREAGVKDEYKHNLAAAEKPEWRALAMYYYPEKVFSAGIMPNAWLSGGDYVNFREISGAVPDVYDSGVVGDTRPGEWLEYEVNAYITDKYELYIRGGDGWDATAAECYAKVYLDGKMVAEHLTIPRANWNIVDIYVGDFELGQGNHIVRIEVAGNDWMVDGCKIDNGKRVPDTEGYDEGMIIEEDEHFQIRNSYLGSDIYGHWAVYDIHQTMKVGYMQGYDLTHFGPDDKLTFKQACLLVGRMIDREDEDWESYSKEVGFIEGNEDYDAPVTREKFISMLMQAYVHKNGGYKITIGRNSFSDADAIDSKYRDAVFGAHELGIIGGYEDGTFRPKNSLTRAEAATMVSESADYI